MKLTLIMPLLALTATSTTLASPLQKRCRISSGQAACWVVWDDHECNPYRAVDVSFEFDEAKKEITITGICESCSRALALEWKLVNATENHHKMNSWATNYGRVEDRGNGTFLLHDVDQESFSFHKRLVLSPWEQATSCVDLDWGVPG